MKDSQRSRLLLIELVCDLVIFAICAVVCVSLLVGARSMSRESTELTQAVYLAQTAADQLRSGVPMELEDIPEGYTLTLTDHGSAANDLSTHSGTITVKKDDRTIYILDIAIPKEVATS